MRDMFEVLIRVLLGWTALSCVAMATWSLLVTRYKQAMNGHPKKVYRLRASTRSGAA